VSLVPGLPLALYLLVILSQRLFELWLSRRNLSRVRPRGAAEVGAAHFPLILALHSAYPVALVAEVWRGARPGAAWPAWLALWLAAQALRIAAMRTLGERWNARIVVVPGEPPIQSGIYRWMPHPNYVAVAVEFVAGPMLFGAWRTALGATLVNALAMALRIPAEERALREAAEGRRP